jgi:hypothetical protein
MIVIGVDVHKHSLTAVAVDEAGRMLDQKTVTAADEELLAWAGGLAGERLWALEDWRQLTRALERQLLAAGVELVRVPPKLMAPERRAGRARGKSSPRHDQSGLRLPRRRSPCKQRLPNSCARPEVHCGDEPKVIWPSGQTDADGIRETSWRRGCRA